jgi:hypothetical protein
MALTELLASEPGFQTTQVVCETYGRKESPSEENFLTHDEQVRRIFPHLTPVSSLRLPKYKELFIIDVASPKYGLFAGKTIVTAYVLDKSDILNKKRIRRKLNQLQALFDKEHHIPKPRSVNTKEYHRLSRKWRTFREEFYGRQIEPLVHQFYSGFDSNPECYSLVLGQNNIREYGSIGADEFRTIPDLTIYSKKAEQKL